MCALSAAIIKQKETKEAKGTKRRNTRHEGHRVDEFSFASFVIFCSASVFASFVSFCSNSSPPRDPREVAHERIICFHRFRRREFLRQRQLVVAVVNAVVAWTAYIDALVELFPREVLFEECATVKFSGNQMMERERAFTSAERTHTILLARFHGGNIAKACRRMPDREIREHSVDITP